MDTRIPELLEIVGAEDGSDAGRPGVLEVNGQLATVILESSGWAEQFIARHRGKPVRIGRQAVLEFWCDGLRVEGPGVRKIVHAAARRMGVE